MINNNLHCTLSAKFLIQAREKDATGGEQRFGAKMASLLNQRIQPYLLRRTKGEVTKTTNKPQNTDNSPNSTHRVAKYEDFSFIFLCGKHESSIGLVKLIYYHFF